MRWLIELWRSLRCYFGYHQPAVRPVLTPETRVETLFTAWPKPDLCQCPHCGGGVELERIEHPEIRPCK